MVSSPIREIQEQKIKFSMVVALLYIPINTILEWTKRPCNWIDGPWCVGGDYIEMLYSVDRKCSSSMNAHSERFHNWVSDFFLHWSTINKSETYMV